jgi:hypothetical protein
MSIIERSEAQKAPRAENGAAENMLADAQIWFDPSGKSPDKTVGGLPETQIWFDPSGKSPDKTVGGPPETQIWFDPSGKCPDKTVGGPPEPDAHDPSGKSRKSVDIEKDSTLVSILLFEGEPHPAVETLSSDLMQLANNKDEYNSLLQKACEKELKLESGNNAPSQLHLALEDFNSKTGTWDMVEIRGNKDSDVVPTRFVQPGNTLQQIAVDLLHEQNFPRELITPEFVNKVVRYTAEGNGIDNPDSIQVGQALNFRHFPEHPRRPV